MTDYKKIRERLNEIHTADIDTIKEALLEFYNVTEEPDIAELIEFIFGEK